MRYAVVLLGFVLIASAAAAGPRELVAELRSDNRELRVAAREALLAAGEEAVPALLEGLAGADPVAAVLCADILGASGSRSARPDLRDVIGSAGAPMLVRRACCRALGRVGDYRDLDLLARFVEEIPEAAVAIAMIGEPEGLALLAPAGRDGAAPEVWYAIAVLGDERGIEGLLAGIEGQNALGALHYLRLAAGADAGRTRADWDRWWARERLARRLGDPDWEASERALSAVREAPTPEIRADLLAIAVDRERGRDSRTKALLALGLIGEAEAGPAMWRRNPAILRLLKEDPDGQVRVYAAEALGRLGVPETAVDLTYYLVYDEEPFRKLSAKARSDPYYTIDSAVCNALVRMGVVGGLDYMIRQLSEEHRIRVYHEALRTLHAVTGQDFGYRPDANRKDRVAAAARWRAWFDEHRGEIGLEPAGLRADAAFRERVAEQVEILGHFKFLEMSRARSVLGLLGEAALPELIEGLDRSENHIRVHCAEVLGWSHLKAGRQALAERLTVATPEVRVAIVAALADVGPGEYGDKVVAALSDEHPDVRIEAARAMARVESGTARRALGAAMKLPANAGEAFQREALTALAKHGDASAVSRLAGMLDSPDASMRQWVADRLLLLTGRDPGVEGDSILRWREWWRVARERYSHGGGAGPGGDGGVTGE